MLSPALFVLNCRNKEEGNEMVKLVDDTSLSGLIQEEDSPYREAVEELIWCCKRNY